MSQCGDGPFLLIGDAQPVIDDAVVGDFELVAKQRRPLQLSNQRLSEFLKSVGEDDDLNEGAQFAEKVQRPLQRSQRADDGLDIGQFQAVLV